MLLERIYDEGLAQASYLVGSPRTGGAVVVDPRRDIPVYLDAARRHGLRIEAVTETHIHADFLSGARELAEAAGARLYLSEEGGPDWTYAFAHEPLRDGTEIRVGDVALTALHTPGHTPEHLSFLVRDESAPGEPAALLTGDFVFVGDLGRPDLLDEAAGGVDTRFEGARQLLASLRGKFLSLPDDVQVWPGHGAGSACGKSLGEAPTTTVGQERRFAWWAQHLERGDAEGFTNELLAGQPDAPTYFGRMKRQNKAGPAPLSERPPLQEYSPERLAAAARDGTALLVDTRPRAAFHQGSLPGALHVPAGKNFATWAGWVIDPERDPRPLVLLGADADAARELRDQLARVGIDRAAGYAPSLDGLELEPQPPLALADAEALPDPFVLDVRARSEHELGSIPGATQIHLGQLPRRLDEVPRDRPVVVHCQSGGRSAAAASFLRAAGLRNVVELDGGYDAWRAARGPTEARP